MVESHFEPGLRELKLEVYEIENHIHNRERWLGSDTGWDGTDTTDSAKQSSIDAFQIDAGNDTWGAGLGIIGSNDTPVIAGMAKYDMHRIEVHAAQVAAVYRIRFAWNDTSYADGVAANDYSEVEFAASVGQQDKGPVDVLMPRLDSGKKVYAACWAQNSNTATIDFSVGLHEYTK